MKKSLVALALVAIALGCRPAQAATPASPVAAAEAADLDASAAVQKQDDGAFLKLHEEILQRAKAGPIDLLFLGDSITARWQLAPHIWEAYYGRYHPANFGVGGDKTQNVIWRIQNGELDGIHPRVVVFLLGTNNTGSNNAPGNSADEIIAADSKILGMIHEKIPEAKVLVLGIFPRGKRKNKDGSTDSGEAKMKTIRAVNAGLAKLDDGRNVRYLDVGDVFLGQDGKIPLAIMSDQLHPTPAGYQLWADAMKPLLDSLMAESGGGVSAR
jgi:lysophospholipase L1-like esterase